MSVRESEVLRLVTMGHPDKFIARQLGVSVWTVNKQVASVLAKMKAASRTEAAVRAIKEELFDYSTAND